MPRLRPVAEAPLPKEPGLFQAPEPELETNSIKLTDIQTEETPPKKEPEVVVDKTPEPDEATLALQKQLADLKKSEELQRDYGRRIAQERDEALRKAQAQATQLEELKKVGFEQEELAVGSALAAAKAESDKALLDYKNALDAGDTSAQAEAMDKLTDAKANLRLLERGKEEIEQRKKEPAKPVETQRTTGDPIDGYDLPSGEKDWLRAHREYITDPDKADELGVIHRRADRKGLRPGMPDYLPFIEDGLRAIGSMPKLKEADDDDTQAAVTDQRASIVSAPVSRETPAGGTGQRQSGKIRLTVEEQEYAKMSGITDVEYAKQKQKLAQHKANGDYGERR